MNIILETERLILRHVDPELDFDAWADCFSDDKTMRFIGGKPMCRAAAWRHMAMVMGHQTIRGYSFYSVICLLYTSPSPRDRQKSRMPSSA